MEKARRLWLIFTAAMLIGIGVALADYGGDEDVNVRQGLQCGGRCCQIHPTDPTKC
ncbi:MAG: hypothetical protein ACK40X_06800 [Armatimonadota bacterium]